MVWVSSFLVLVGLVLVVCGFLLVVGLVLVSANVVGLVFLLGSVFGVGQPGFGLGLGPSAPGWVGSLLGVFHAVLVRFLVWFRFLFLLFFRVFFSHTARFCVSSSHKP